MDVRNTVMCCMHSITILDFIETGKNVEINFNVLLIYERCGFSFSSSSFSCGISGFPNVEGSNFLIVLIF